MSAIADDPGLARRMDTYLRQSLAWLHDYAGAGGKRINRTFPYEWSANLAKAIGRFALASGAADLWRPLADFDKDRDAERCVSQYLDALTRDLTASSCAPDARFWTARGSSCSMPATPPTPPSKAAVTRTTTRPSACSRRSP